MSRKGHRGTERSKRKGEEAEIESGQDNTSVRFSARLSKIVNFYCPLLLTRPALGQGRDPGVTADLHKPFHEKMHINIMVLV